MSTASRSVKKPVSGIKVAFRDLRGQALLDDMLAYKEKVTASPAAARDFLMELGVLTAEGKTRQLIRD